MTKIYISYTSKSCTGIIRSTRVVLFFFFPKIRQVRSSRSRQGSRLDCCLYHRSLYIYSKQQTQRFSLQQYLLVFSRSSYMYNSVILLLYWILLLLVDILSVHMITYMYEALLHIIQI